MKATSYTTHDTPDLVQRIESDLAIVLDTLRAGDPYLRALILTGGFARGEGMTLDGAPQNDYDFVAVRGLGMPHVPYDDIRQRLEARLGLHIDLATVQAWRLRWTAPTVFWYETARRGRVLWGDQVLHRIPQRQPSQLAANEGLRLLANRAAGLLLATAMNDAHAIRIQAAKAILAALDAHLLAAGKFAPSQTERMALVEHLRPCGVLRVKHDERAAWWLWAYQYKINPASAPARDANQAWQAARAAILEALPTALHRAGNRSLAQHGRSDRLIDRIVYARQSSCIDGARRFLLHPSSGVRVATLRLLQATPQRHLDGGTARRCLARFARNPSNPLHLLERLRAATLQ